MSIVIVLILTHVVAFACGAMCVTMRARRRRTRDMLIGYGAGWNVAGQYRFQPSKVDYPEHDSGRSDVDGLP